MAKVNKMFNIIQGKGYVPKCCCLSFSQI